jgi:hypothetical protein
MGPPQNGDTVVPKSGERSAFDQGLVMRTARARVGRDDRASAN